MSDIALFSTIHVDEDTSVDFALRDILAEAGYVTTRPLSVTDLSTDLPDGDTVWGDTPLLGLVGSDGIYVRPGQWEQHYNGTFTTFQFMVEDDDGNYVSLELRVVIDPVNDAPTGADKAFDMDDRAPLALKASDFGFADAVEGDAFKSVIVESLPAHGTIRLNGGAVAAGVEITVADINAGKLTFVPGAHGSGIVEMGFHVRDNGGTAGTGAQDTSEVTNYLTFKVPAPDTPDTPDTPDVPETPDTPGGGNPGTGAPTLATIGDTVWNDANANGIQDAGEGGIAGITMALRDVDGTVLQTTTTDATGQYKFEVGTGTYSVALTAPKEWQATAQGVGGNRAVDSDFDAGGVTAPITVTRGDVYNSADAGLYRATAALGNKVWHDSDGDGFQDAGESGIRGLKVTLLDANGKPLATTMTDGSGQYFFTGLAAGTYSVQFDKSALPAGYAFTQQNAGKDDTRDSDVNGDGRSHQVALKTGEINDTIDAGIAATATIRSTVWEDRDFDGVQDKGETGIGGVTVKLYDANHQLQGTTVTAADGTYTFGKLAAGSYSVEVVRPNGYFATKANVGSDATDSDFKTVGTTAIASSGVFKLAAGEQNTGIDAGLYRKASIGDKVWRDANHNGVQDKGEEGIGKIKVMLVDATSNKVLATTTTTDSKGSYLFDNLDPGSYYLKFDKSNVKFTDAKGYTYAMNDWKWGTQDTGRNDLVDSDVKGDGISKANVTLTAATTLSSGENDMSWDAAITPIAIDLDGNGIHTIARADFAGSFDLLGTGNAIKSGWLSSGDAFLAIDANGNSRIDDISELFGGASKGSGFAKLASFDSNGDGFVTADDAQFALLTLWRDANGNGTTDAGELLSLAQAGATSLAVAFEELPFLDAQGNLHLERSSAVIDGREVSMTDVYFNVAAADVAAAGLQVDSMAQLIGQAATFA